LRRFIPPLPKASTLPIYARPELSLNPLLLNSPPHRNKTNTPPKHHTLISALPYALKVMRCAYVVRLGPKTNPAEGKFEGWVEEVDTGKGQRFCSRDELLHFLGECFRAVPGSEHEDGNSLKGCGELPD